MIRFNLLLLLPLFLTLTVNAQQARSVKHVHSGKVHTHVLPNNGKGRHSHGRSRANVNRKGQAVKHAHNGKLHWHVLPNNGRGKHGHRRPHNNVNASMLKRRIRHNHNDKTHTHILPSGEKRHSHRGAAPNRNNPSRASRYSASRRSQEPATQTQLIQWINASRPNSQTQTARRVQTFAPLPRSTRRANNRFRNVESRTQIATKPITSPTTRKVTTVTSRKLPIQQFKKKTAATFQQKSMYVDASRLHVRNLPNKKGKVIWQLKRDQKVQVTNKDGNWLYIENSRFKGWVYGTYLTRAPAPKQARAPEKQKKVVKEFSTTEIKKILINRSLSDYPGNCPCPENRASNGSRCGKRSAWSRPGGRSPLCYESDITAQMVSRYKDRL